MKTSTAFRVCSNIARCFLFLLKIRKGVLRSGEKNDCETKTLL
nr:MAG TPA: hypothetical protein [Caudoviricetes sp.]